MNRFSLDYIQRTHIYIKHTKYGKRKLKQAGLTQELMRFLMCNASVAQLPLTIFDVFYVCALIYDHM